MINLADELLGPLDVGDAVPLRTWLGESLTDAGLSPGRLAALSRFGRWNDGGSSGVALSGDVLAALRDSVRIAAPAPQLSALLALYVRHECSEAWEISWDHGPIRTAIAAAVAERSRCDGRPGTAAGPAWGLLQLLDREMLVESAAATGTLTALSEHARLAAAEAAAVAASCAEIPPGPLADHLVAVAERENCYYTALATAAEAAEAHTRTGDGGLAQAVTALRAAESAFADDDACRSELRAHRASLEALQDAAGRPWLRIDSGTVVYVYPFGLRRVTAGSAVRALRDTGHRWTLAGLPVDGVALDLPLNDIWNGNDPLGRQYAGAAVTLPDLLLPDADRGEPHRLRAELRLTELGNHCVRIEADLTGAGPQELYAALLRAAPEAGDLRELGTPIVPADGAGTDTGWGRLTDLAAAICADVCSQFAQHAELPDVQVSARGGTYHVITRIGTASTFRPDGSGPEAAVEHPEALLGLVGGALLDHPVRHGISALAEWIRYPCGDGTRITAPGMVGDLLVRTENTTTIASPRAPSYMVDPLQEAAEFVATLDGLFAGWQVELADLYYRISREMEQLREEVARRPAAEDRDRYWDDSHLDRKQRDLESAQHEMQLFVMASRLRLMFITAPSLVTSPVMRTTLDHLLRAAGFEQARADFVGTVDDVVGDRAWTLIDSSVRRRQDMAEDRRREQLRAAEAQRAHDEARGRRRMDILLAAVAAIGVSGILSILQAGYDLRGWMATGLALCAVLTAGAAGAITHRLTTPALQVPAPSPRRPGEDGGRADPSRR